MSLRKLIAPGAIGLAAFAGIAGGLLLTSLIANADTGSGGSSTNTSTTSSDTTSAAPADTSTASAGTSTPSTSQIPPQHDASLGGHVGANGTKETLLTGDTATKATAAAQAAVSGGTILRVETDAEDATYEAHVKKSDGSQVTVKMDANYNVTSIENDPALRAGG